MMISSLIFRSTEIRVLHCHRVHFISITSVGIECSSDRPRELLSVLRVFRSAWNAWNAHIWWAFLNSLQLPIAEITVLSENQHFYPFQREMRAFAFHSSISNWNACMCFMTLDSFLRKKIIMFLYYFLRGCSDHCHDTWHLR